MACVALLAELCGGAGVPADAALCAMLHLVPPRATLAAPQARGALVVLRTLLERRLTAAAAAGCQQPAAVRTALCAVWTATHRAAASADEVLVAALNGTEAFQHAVLPVLMALFCPHDAAVCGAWRRRAVSCPPLPSPDALRELVAVHRLDTALPPTAPIVLQWRRRRIAGLHDAAAWRDAGALVADAVLRGATLFPRLYRRPKKPQHRNAVGQQPAPLGRGASRVGALAFHVTP